MRLTRPRRTARGPHSTKSVAPIAWQGEEVVSRQRTGLRRFSASSSWTSGERVACCRWRAGEGGVVDRGRVERGLASCRPRAPCSGEWKAPPTSSVRPRQPIGLGLGCVGCVQRSVAPERTIWPGALSLATLRPSSRGEARGRRLRSPRAWRPCRRAAPRRPRTWRARARRRGGRASSKSIGASGGQRGVLAERVAGGGGMRASR